VRYTTGPFCVLCLIDICYELLYLVYLFSLLVLIFYWLILGGLLFLFDRKVLRYFRRDGHNWRKKKDGKTVKEAHEKLKVRACFYSIIL
jgi:CG-1 domain